MALSFPDATLDLALGVIKDNVTRLDVCSDAPASDLYANIAGVSLATVTVATGDFTIGAGDVSGRKVTLAQQTGETVTTTGTATHLVLSNGTDTLYATLTITSQALTSGNDLTVNAVDVWEIRDVIAE